MGFSLFDVRSMNLDNEVLDDTYVPGTPIAVSSSTFWPKVALQCIAANTGAAPVVLTIWRGYGAGTYPCRVASVTIPAGAGVGGVPPVDALAALVPTPLGLLVVSPDCSFLISLETAPSAGAEVNVSWVEGQF
jgi:hypothetical protein